SEAATRRKRLPLSETKGADNGPFRLKPRCATGDSSAGAVPRRAPRDRRLLARGQLLVGRTDLSLREPVAARAAQGRAHQAAASRPLGHDAGPKFHLRTPQPVDQEVRSERDLRHRPRARRPRTRGKYLPRGDLQRGLSTHPAKRRGDEAALQAILLSRGGAEPRRAGDTGID